MSCPIASSHTPDAPIKISGILYVNALNFPLGSPGALRALAVAKALRHSGHSVSFATNAEYIRDEDRVGHNIYEYEGFKYYPREIPRSQRWRGLYTNGEDIVNWLSAQDLSETEALIAYNASASMIIRLRRLCDIRGIALIADITEWYRFVEKCSPEVIDTALRMKWAYRLTDGVIAISSYLENYYRKRKVPVILVPALIDSKAVRWRDSRCCTTGDDGSIRLLFAGTPYRDNLTAILQAVDIIRKRERNVILEFMGSSQQTVIENLGCDAHLIERLGNGVFIHGKLPFENVATQMASADYAIMLRPVERWSQACFPSKMPEFLTVGTPIIANATSDIGDYIVDGKHGILVADNTARALVEALERVAKLGNICRTEMRCACVDLAESAFDYRGYSTRLSDFMTDITCAKQKR